MNSIIGDSCSIFSVPSTSTQTILLYSPKKWHSKVYKKDLKNKYKISKEFLFDFTANHPEVLQAYKNTLPREATPINDSDIENQQRIPRDTTSIDGTELSNIPPGRETANVYHEFILGVLTEIFYPWLTHPVKEQVVDQGTKRIDIQFRNSATDGFFSRMVHIYQIYCPYVSVECKNYAEDPENPELDQLIGRLSRKRGKFGVLICRKIENRTQMLKRLQSVVNNHDRDHLSNCISQDVGLCRISKRGGQS